MAGSISQTAAHGGLADPLSTDAVPLPPISTTDVSAPVPATPRWTKAGRRPVLQWR